MKQSLRMTALAALIVAGQGLTALAAHPVPARSKASANTEAFRWAPASKAEQSRWKNTSSAIGKAKAPSAVTPDASLKTGDTFAYLDMPDGTTWFVVADYEKTILTQNEYYTDYDITGIKATIYNDRFEPVGKIEDTIEKPEGFAQCTSVQFGPAVSQKFFNTDSSYELMFMMNFRPENGYGAVPYTNVYSLKGADTNAARLETIKGYYTAAINNAADSWSEDFFMEFFTGEEYTDSEMFYTFDILTKASYSSPKATAIGSFKVDMVYVMSDGENETLPVLLNSRGNDLYVAVCRYEKTFFQNPFDPFDDALSPDNNYTIKLYRKFGNELREQSETKIPCDSPAEGFTMRSYCLGQFMGIQDLSFDFTDDGAPAFIISVSDSNIQEETSDFFAVYDTAGDIITTFGEDNGGYLALSSIEGQPEQFCFLEMSPSGDYGFQFYDYPAMEPKAFIAPSVWTGTEDLALSLNIDRVAGGDSYRYAVSSLQGEVDAADNVVHRVAWFDAGGEFIKVDRLNGGKDVHRIDPFISCTALNPFLINTDASHEYMILVLRGTGESTQAATEFCIVNDKEEMLFQRQFDVLDSSISISLVNTRSNPAFWIVYRSHEDGIYHNEFITLPLNKLEGEGTAESPYLIKSAGDFNEIRNNLSACYRLTADIDFDGITFQTVSGTFSGVIDGAGHTVRNLRLGSGPIFKTFGDLGSSATAELRDITFTRPTVTGKTNAIIADATYKALLSGVHIYNAEIASDAISEFGALAANTFSTVISGCSFNGVLDLPECGTLGGLVAVLGNNSSVKASSVNGSITGSTAIGGIASEIRSTASVTDCHVTADITGKNSIGGITAYSARGYIARNIVEGSITASEAGQRMSYITYQPYRFIHVGGIAGELTTAASLGEESTEPSTPSMVIENNLVALSSITIPEGDDLLATAHRIVGRSRVNDDPQIIQEIYDEELGDWTFELGDPAPAEAFIASNYSLADLPLLHSEVAADHNTTEGKDVAYDALDDTFFTTLGLKFNGYSAEEPWVFGMTAIPSLYFESTVGQALYFAETEVSVASGETAAVTLVLEGIEPDALILESSDEDSCMATPVELTPEGNVIVEISVMKAGTYTVTASSGTLSSELKVYGLTGITEVAGGSSAITFDGTAVRAEGCSITLYNVGGIAIASGNGSVSVSSLPAGVYIATATDPAGNRSTLKVAVK